MTICLISRTCSSFFCTSIDFNIACVDSRSPGPSGLLVRRCVHVPRRFRIRLADGLQLADWLEFYAHSLELNVWTSSPATSVRQDPATNKWTVVVNRGTTGKDRIFHPVHVVFAVGFLAGAINMPEFPGRVSVLSNSCHSIDFTVIFRMNLKDKSCIPLCTSLPRILRVRR